MKRLITRQSDVNDCGPAVIYSLVKYYKGYVSLERIKLDTHLDKTGISAYDMVLALNSYGFDAKGLKLTIEDLKTTKIPLILHCIYNNSYGHFILLLKTSKKKVTIMNPSRGIEKISWEELNTIWTGIAIKAIPLGNIIHLGKEKTLKDLFLSTFRVYKKELITIIFLGIILSLISLILSYYLKVVVHLNSLYIIILFIILTIFKAILSSIFESKVISTDWRLSYDFTKDFINHLFLLPISNLDLISMGRINKYVNDLNTFKEAFLELILSIFLGLLEIISILSLIFIINNTLGLLLIIILSIYLVLKLLSIKLNKKDLKNTIVESNSYQEVLLETIRKVKMIKRLSKSDYFLNNFKSKLLNYLDTNKTYLHSLSKYKVIEEFFLDILNILSISIALILVNKNLIELVDLFTYLALSTTLINTLKECLNSLPRISYLEENYLHLSEFMSLKEEEFEGLTFTSGNISIQNVSFTYNSLNYVIKNLNQEIKSGEKIILTGESGSGKSSLVKLLFGFYKPTTGNILINGINLSDYNLNSLRNSISYVSQDESLFKGSILENITLGKDIPVSKLTKVLKICCLDKLINKETNHLETILLEDDVNFSGGEVMRLILARTLLKDNKILILDEALSGVEESMEKNIIKNIKNEYPDITLIYITHRNLKELFDREIKLDN